MADHALRTAVTLYEAGTLDRDTAASHAGVSPERLARRAAAATVSVPETTTTDDRDRVRLAGD